MVPFVNVENRRWVRYIASQKNVGDVLVTLLEHASDTNSINRRRLRPETGKDR